MNELGAKEILNRIATRNIFCTLEETQLNAFWLAEQALEKQVAKKPYILPISQTDNFTYCPNCKTDGLLVAPSMSYCCGCGQKLDWSDEE